MYKVSRYQAKSGATGTSELTLIILVSPVQDIELPSYSGSIVRYNQNRSRPGRHERGPYGQYKDDSGKIDITKVRYPFDFNHFSRVTFLKNWSFSRKIE